MFGFPTINWVSARVSESCQNGIITRRCHTLISQGSVATRLKCGGIFNDGFISDSPLNLAVKELRESVSIRRSYQQEYSGTFSNSQLPTARSLCATMCIVWPGGVMVRTLDSRLKGSRVQLSAVPLSGSNLRQVVHTHVPLSPSSINWYPSKGDDGVGLASHWPSVRDFISLSTYGLNGLRKGDEPTLL